MNDQLKKAVKTLVQGGIIIFPTDTAYGIGCRIDDPKALERLFEIRKRPKNQPVPILVSSIKMAQEYLQPLSEEVKDLMRKYWPGGLTIVYPCQKERVPSLVRGGGKNLGARMPDHQIPLTLIQRLRVPIIGTSANIHGDKTPYQYQDLDPKLTEKVDLVIKGKCPKRKASTVLDCSKKPWRILRKGALEEKNLPI